MVVIYLTAAGICGILEIKRSKEMKNLKRTRAQASRANAKWSGHMTHLTRYYRSRGLGYEDAKKMARQHLTAMQSDYAMGKEVACPKYSMKGVK